MEQSEKNVSDTQTEEANHHRHSAEGALLLHIPVAGWGDKVKKCVDAVVSEARVTLDPRLFRQNIIILSFQIAEDLLEAGVDHAKDTKQVIRLAG